MTEAHPAAEFSAALTAKLGQWGLELGFQRVGVTGVDLATDAERLDAWLAAGYHGQMQWMASHGSKRYRPAELVPGTRRVVSARMDYWPEAAADAAMVLNHPELGYVSRYALGRDYHKVLRGKLKQLAERLIEHVGDGSYRVFTDSAPVLEKPLARNAGLGWIGKHTNLIHRDAGSWFFLGEFYTDLPLATTAPMTDSHCGTCSACLEVCPTRAIVAPFQLDARRCISYLTIEHDGPVPEALRPAFGNRIYGCDDCQLVCPWNRYARPSALPDFLPRQGLDAPSLARLFRWSETEFLDRTLGSAIRRIGHTRWLRNIAIALGNGLPGPTSLEALEFRRDSDDAVLREHIAWAKRKLLAKPQPPASD